MRLKGLVSRSAMTAYQVRARTTDEMGRVAIDEMAYSEKEVLPPFR